jgi:hypothetical protein
MQAVIAFPATQAAAGRSLAGARSLATVQLAPRRSQWLDGSSVRGMKRRSIAVAGVLMTAVVGGTTSLAMAASDDEARLDAAMEVFNERMIAAGWESQGPVDDDDDQDDDDAETEGAGDEALRECFGEMPTIFEDLDADEFPGQTASSESEEFLWPTPSDSTDTTEAFSFDLTEETAAAFAATVDDANIATVTEFVDVFGAKETGDCIREGLEAEMAAESEDSEIPVEFDVSVSNEGDLGIGEHSAALSFEVSTVFMVPITVRVDVVFAQVGNDIAGIAYTATGDPQSDFEPRAELQLIVDSLGS